MDPTSTQLPEDACPRCGHELSGATGAGTPTPGDYSVCAYCAMPLVFKSDLSVRAMDDEDVSTMSNATYQKLLNLIQHVEKRK